MERSFKTYPKNFYESLGPLKITNYDSCFANTRLLEKDAFIKETERQMDEAMAEIWKQQVILSTPWFRFVGSDGSIPAESAQVKIICRLKTNSGWTKDFPGQGALMPIFVVPSFGPKNSGEIFKREFRLVRQNIISDPGSKHGKILEGFYEEI